MTSVQDSYAAEVKGAKDRLKRLKDRYQKRATVRRVGPAGPTAQGAAGEATENGGKVANGNEASDAAADATLLLRKVIAACLLDPANNTPLDSAGLHRRLSKPEFAAKYEDALMRAGQDHTLDGTLREMAGGANPVLEVEDYEQGGKNKLMVLSIMESKLTSLVGEAPAAAASPREGQQPRAASPQPPGPPGVPGDAPQARPGPGAGAMPPPPAGLPHPRSLPPPGAPPDMPHGPSHLQNPHFHQGAPPLGTPPPFNMRPPLMAPPGMGPPGMPQPMGMFGMPLAGVGPRPNPGSDLDAILSRPTIRDKNRTERGAELLDLIQKPTAKESATVNQFKTEGGSVVREYCPHLTKEDCRMARGNPFACSRMHFLRIIFPWTDRSLGNCSYLDTCRHTRTCKYVHYQLDEEPDVPEDPQAAAAKLRPNVPKYLAALPEPQWIKCDVRNFDMSVLGQYGVIMTDPPWEIHQDLPYGTMGDHEMRHLNVGVLQDEGVIFVWVTGRAMELGRECLEIWGYKRVDELIWVKTNQLQRLIRTGRTGHWLNHSKEHCLVGIKGNPQINRNLDCDVLLAEVRETSRKPDEMYSLIERLSPGTRKLEIFARQHNVRPGWVSLGNQLDGVKIMDSEMKARYDAKYVDGS
ncbi:hypothetical protein WJX74_004366 [Apatococcus lobatus]|uniref:Uncharacterized protein n=1 Tax=Apatococcus lobatus TaxID=904363 RepID=A0AAW1QDG4_9CHLO